jgi:hypothetical protein
MPRAKASHANKCIVVLRHLVGSTVDARRQQRQRARVMFLCAYRRRDLATMRSAGIVVDA